MDRGMSPKKRGGKKMKDPNKPKRAISAYFWFMNTYRQNCKKINKTHPTVADFTREAAAKWRALTKEEKVPYEEQNRIDKERYAAQMKNYTPTTASGRAKPKKDPNAPKRPQNGFFLFMNDYRAKHKNDDGKSYKALVSEAGNMWNKTMTQAERRPYEDKHAELKVQYEKDLAKYKAGQSTKAKSSVGNGAKHKAPVDDDDDDEDMDDSVSEEEDEDMSDDDDE